MQHLLEINENKQKTEKLLSYPISYPLCHLHQIKNIKMKLTQFRIYFNVADQVHIVNKKELLQNVDILSLKSKIHQWIITAAKLSGSVTIIACVSPFGSGVRKRGVSLTVTSFTRTYISKSRWCSRCGMLIPWWVTIWYVMPVWGWRYECTPVTVEYSDEPRLGSYPCTLTGRLKS